MAGALIATTAAATLANVGMGWWTNEQKKKELKTYLNAMNKLKKKIETDWKQLKDPMYPAYDGTPLTSEELMSVGKYQPELAQYVQEKQPQMISEASSFGAKAAQDEALGIYQQKARGGETAAARASRAKGMYEADASSRGALDRILAQGPQDAGTRATLAAQANQSQDVARYQAAMQAAAQDEASQMSALQGMAGLAGNIRSQNYNVESANTDIINSFNQRAAQNQWIYNQQKANTMNNAQQFNLGEQQRIADSNVGLRNQTNAANRARQDSIQQGNANIYNTWQGNDVANRNNQLQTIVGIESGNNVAAQKGMSDYWGNTGQGWSQLITGIPTAATNAAMYNQSAKQQAAQNNLTNAQANYLNRYGSNASASSSVPTGISNGNAVDPRTGRYVDPYLDDLEGQIK